MTNLHPVPHNQESEALYWLDVAKRILEGDIRPDEALHVLRLGTLYLEASEAEDDQPTLSAAGQSAGQTPR
jgi:hypothetical protein